VHAAARYAQAHRDAPASVSIVTGAEITAFGYRTVGEVLASVAGLYVTYDRNYTYLGVRGIGRLSDYNNRILLLLNGYPLNEGVYGGAQLGPELGIDPRTLDRVEVVRGPVSALYGTNAMLAVVNLVTRERVDSPWAMHVGSDDNLGVSAQHSLPLLGGAGSLYVSAAGATTKGKDQHYEEFGDTPNGGVAEDLDGEQHASALVVASLRDLKVLARASHRTKGIPTAPWGVEFNDSRAETVDDWLMLSATGRRTFGPGFSAELAAGLDAYRYRGVYPYADYNFTDATDARRLSASALILWDAAAALRVSAGTAFERHARADYRTYYDGVPDYGFNSPFTTAGVYGQAELNPRHWLTISGGLRFDLVEPESGHLTPRLAVLLRPGATTTIKLLYGEAFRSPNAYEGTYEVGEIIKSEFLEPEQIRTLEAVVEQSLPRSTTLRLSLYADRLNGLIDLVTDGDDLYQFRNSANVAANGAELEMTSALGAWLVKASGSVVRAEDVLAGGELTNVPQLMSRLGLSGPTGAGLFTAVQLRYESGRGTLQDRRTGDVALLDGRVSWQPTRRLTAALGVKNIFDAAHYVPGRAEHAQDMLRMDGRKLEIEGWWRR
jgi:iron complex outermembrane receptor protein